jgi:hypothetical protein
MDAGTNTPSKALSRKLVRFLLIGTMVVTFLVAAPDLWFAFTNPAALDSPLLVAWGVFVIASYMVIWVRFVLRSLKASR